MFYALLVLIAIFFSTNEIASVLLARRRGFAVSARLLLTYHGEILIFGLRAVWSEGTEAFLRAEVLVSLAHFLSAALLLVVTILA